MGCCSALGCTNRKSKKIDGITFHLFPKDEKRRQLWIKAVNRSEHWAPSKYSTLCSMHFTEEMFDRSSDSLVRLHENAVPSIFENFTEYHQKTFKILEMIEKAAGNAHVAPVAYENHLKSEQDYEESDASKSEEDEIAKNEESDIAEDDESDMDEDEKSDIDEDEAKITEEEENYPLTKESYTEKVPNTEFVTYIVCEGDQQQPNSSMALIRSNNASSKDTSKIKDIISNVFQLESQVQVEEGNKKTDLLHKLAFLEKKLERMRKQREKDKKKLRTLFQSQRRSVKKIAALNESISSLKLDQYTAYRNGELLEGAPPVLVELLSRLKSLNSEKFNYEYSLEAREFIKNLYTISPAAYRYIRDHLILSLPLDRTVSKWKYKTNNILVSGGERNFDEDNSSSNDIDVQILADEENDDRIFSVTENDNVNWQESDMQCTDI